MSLETEFRLASAEANSSLVAEFPIVRSLIDLANLVTLGGLCAAVAGVYCAARGEVYLGAALLGVALLCDMLDGNVARRYPNRPLHLSRLGVEFDSLSDVVHGGVLPGMLLTTVAGVTALSVIAAQALCVCAVMRLAHFNVFGLTGGAAYRGVPVIFNSLITALLIAIVPSWLAPLALFVSIVALAALNISNIRIPKMKGISLRIFIGLNVIAILANLEAAAFR